MNDPALQRITNYRRISDRIGTAGMPTEAQVGEIARAGFEVVINLDQLDSSHALPNEQATVEALGMIYRQIPVIWEHPTHGNLTDFFAAMEDYAGKRVFVHCVANYRATIFTTLYGILRLGWPYAEAVSRLHLMWQPNEIWQHFIESELAE